MARVWIFAEHAEGRPRAITLELLALARPLGEVEAVALGPGARAAAGALGAHGAARVHVNEDPAFAEYLAEPATDCLAALAGSAPDLILFGFTSDSREVAGRLAARLGVGLISNATDVSASDGGFRARVPYFGGARVATYRANSSPAIVVVRPKSVEASETGGEAEVVEVDAAIGERSRRARIVETHTEAGEQVKLEDAQVVVSGGRGLGGPEHFHLIEELAGALGGAAGASRAIVDAGWVPYALQVGQTGKTVRPGVYIAAGISGAMQHTVGMKASKVIVAINKDAEAPILKMADLGVVGDVLKILPRLTEAVRARKAQ
ncbi:MAG: electron transfer flavoprotein subunit alpha/FixB family protein [Candidatus Nephthysia bennettiae]|uniref:Electron transfer flavoprotein subunit alpha/FixB family protein n=1 Tax=Candidatus Nephthysia bennettiae TaxID=3127016 RepID=A0A934NAM3_9BACT|nr:electron transfer flavoprotein subunit alpha/FixB family protein [Candidatus Dormibacteraeota bacterium]PZR93865.1 MAG: electron transfer flavoprotein subunit alpha/FixB family protein [Candidatus Dormibacteraeota bacterium]